MPTASEMITFRPDSVSLASGIGVSEEVETECDDDSMMKVGRLLEKRGWFDGKEGRNGLRARVWIAPL